MGVPAARLGDAQACPMTTPTPHGAGSVIAGEPSVCIGGLPSARLGDPVVCAGAPVPGNVVVCGSASVLIRSLPAARLGGRADGSDRRLSRLALSLGLAAELRGQIGLHLVRRRRALASLAGLGRVRRARTRAEVQSQRGGRDGVVDIFGHVRGLSRGVGGRRPARSRRASALAALAPLLIGSRSVDLEKIVDVRRHDLGRMSF